MLRQAVESKALIFHTLLRTTALAYTVSSNTKLFQSVHLATNP
jgi:hypothetical protein